MASRITGIIGLCQESNRIWQGLELSKKLARNWHVQSRSPATGTLLPPQGSLRTEKIETRHPRMRRRRRGGRRSEGNRSRRMREGSRRSRRRSRGALKYRTKTHRLLGSKFSPKGVRGDHASVFNDRATPCSTHSEVCSSVAKLASKTRPTPMAFRRSCVT